MAGGRESRAPGDAPIEAPIDEAEGAALFAPLAGRPLALAVSGGADSMALLHLMAAWQRSSRTRPSDGVPPIIVLTVDHGLRAEAAGEARAVAAAAAALGLPHRTLHWSGAKPATGLQAAAREARYRLLASAIADASPADAPPECARWLVTAHHRDDVAETFLMRLARGSGLEGLAAMRPVSRLLVDGDQPHEPPLALTIARPLLDVPKHRLVATLHERGIAWCEDPSNADPRHERVRVRQGLQAGDAVSAEVSAEAIARSAVRLRRAEATIAHIVDRLAAAAVAAHPGAQAEIELAEILSAGMRETRDAPDEITVRLLARLIGALGGQAQPVRLAKVEALAARLLADPAPTGTPLRVTLGGCVIERVQRRERPLLRVRREPGRSGLPVVPLPPGARIWWDRRFLVTASADAPAGAVVRALGPAGWRRLREERPEVSRLEFPVEAARTLPGVWMGNDLLAAPSFDHARERLSHGEPVFAARPLMPLLGAELPHG